MNNEMEREAIYARMLDILEEELVPATGCTEAIAIAYCAAVAKHVLQRFPERLEIECSGNILKNASGVTVPNSGGLKGVEVSALMGIICGDPDKKMQVIEYASDDDRKHLNRLLREKHCSVGILPGTDNLNIVVTARSKNDFSQVTVKRHHTNVVKIVRNGTVMRDCEGDLPGAGPEANDHALLTLENILSFAQDVDLARVRNLVERQVEYNMAIAQEGLSGSYGVGLGKLLLNSAHADTFVKAKAYAAAAAEARMCGSSKPVITNSGSGNQGITVSLPVATYAREEGISDDTRDRALILSNLIAIRLRSGMGRLSAFCGAVTAACGAGCAITYMSGGNAQRIESTLVNILGNISGVVCDGAKTSCALKIASALDAAFMGHQLSLQAKVLDPRTGILKDSAESTMESVEKLGREGMRETDRVILETILENMRGA